MREPLLLDRCVICWDREWDDCFEVTEFTTKESYIFKVSFELKFMDVRSHSSKKVNLIVLLEMV